MELSWRIANSLAGDRLDKVVTLVPGALGLSRQQARTLVERGAVTLDGRAVRLSSHRVRGGEALKVRLAHVPKTPAPEIRVLHEDEDLIAVDKPPGIPSEPTRDPKRPSVLGVFAERAVGLPHRLDAETSGVLVLAKTKESLARLGAIFESRDVKKIYEALVQGRLEGERTIESFLASGGRRKGKEFFQSVRSGGKKAITRVRALGEEGDRTRVECELVTGRTHQLRVHLSEAGHPIVGDELYGAPRAERLFLHARRLELPGLALEARPPF